MGMPNLLRSMWGSVGRGQFKENHALTDKDDYHRNFYMKSLCMMATLDGALSDEQILLLQWLIAEAKCSYSMDEYIRQGRDMGDEDIKELMEETLQGDLAYSFFFDLMILHHIAPIQSHTSAFLEEVAEGLSLDVKLVSQLSEACTAILKNKKLYEPKEFPNECVIRVIIPYLSLCNMYVQYITATHYYIRYAKMTPYSIDRAAIEGKCVFLGNIISNESIRFCNCPEVVLQNCRFKGFKSFVLGFEGGVKCMISSCHFEDCYREYASECSDWSKESQLFGFGAFSGMSAPLADIYGSLGQLLRRTYGAYGFMVGEEPVYSIELRDSEFIRCGGKNESAYYRTAIIGGKHVKAVRRCTFRDCWHYHNNNQKDDGTKCTLFAPDTKNVNNTVMNSAKFQ